MRLSMLKVLALLIAPAAHAAELKGGPAPHARDYGAIAHSARVLKAQTDTMANTMPTADYAAAIAALADETARASTALKAEGDPDEMSCILGGISRDLPVRLKALTEAKTPAEQDAALKDMSRLLDDSATVVR